MQITITTTSKFGDSKEVVEIKDKEAKQILIKRLRRLHEFDGSTVTFSNYQKGYFEQIL